MKNKISFQNPPPAVKLVMESVCVMLSIKSERKPDPQGSGKMIEDFWGPSQRLLGDMKFLERLKTYDKDNIPAPVMKRIREKSVSFFFFLNCHPYEYHMIYVVSHVHPDIKRRF